MTHLTRFAMPAILVTLLTISVGTIPARAQAGIWSAPVDVSQASQPAFSQALVIDSNDTTHLIFQAVPGFGTVQLFHAFKRPGQGWSAPVAVSLVGQGASFPAVPEYAFLQEDAAGDLHLFFEAIPGVFGVRQVWHTALAVDDPAAGWSAPVNVSQASQPAFSQALVIDSNQTLHLVFQAVPGFGTVQLFHSYKLPGQGWSAPAAVSLVGQGASFPALPEHAFLQEDAAGILHLFFEAIPGVFGVQQVWHTALAGDDLAAGWSAPVNVSQASQPALARAVAVDSEGSVHLIFLAIPGFGTVQLFHAHGPPKQAWSSPVQVSHTSQAATFPVAFSYAFFLADGGGLVHLFFESIPGVGVQQIWHSDLLVAVPDFELLVGTFFGDAVLRYGQTGAFLGAHVPPGSGGLNVATGLAVGPDGHLYVGSRDTDAVLRFAGATGQFLGVFAGGDGLDNPTGLLFGPDGHLYVSGFLSDAVLRYDGTTGQFLGVFAAGGGLDGPEGLAFGPGGDLFVANHNGDSVLRYDGDTGSFVGVFAAAGLDGPIGLTFGPDGKLYVGSHYNDSVIRYEGDTGIVLDTFVSGGLLDGPIDVRFGPDRYLYVVSQVNDKILRYDPASGALDGDLNGGNGPDAGTYLAFRPRILFADGFESGDTSRWSAVQ
jgi:streptogramin lyase